MPETGPVDAASDHERSERLHKFAHDLRNRLTGLWEVLRAIRSGEAGMDPDELMGFAEKGYFQAQREIESLLDDMQVDRRVRITESAPVSLQDMIAFSLKREQHRLDRKGQSVTLDGTRTASVVGDAHWIGQIVQALMSNASKFSTRGSVIHLSIKQEGPRTLLMVRDPGVGLSEADLDGVFVRFAVLGSRSTDGEQQARGTLARARQWAQAMHGELSAHSEGVGRGCTFTLTLPSAK